MRAMIEAVLIVLGGAVIVGTAVTLHFAGDEHGRGNSGVVRQTSR